MTERTDRLIGAARIAGQSFALGWGNPYECEDHIIPAIPHEFAVLQGRMINIGQFASGGFRAEPVVYGLWPFGPVSALGWAWDPTVPWRAPVRL